MTSKERVLKALAFEKQEVIEELLDVFWALQKAYIDTIIKINLAPAFVYCDDLAFKDSLLFSPQWLEAHYLPV